jgi:hypothetical protein
MGLYYFCSKQRASTSISTNISGAMRPFISIILVAGGKDMNFYLSAVDDLLRHPGDNPSIGLILCRSKVGVVAEYALRDMTKPIGLAEYRLTESLPENLKTALPTIEELEAELSKDLGKK